MSNRPPLLGELVEVIEPHREAGARGVIVQKYRQNKDYRARARVKFQPPYGEGSEVIALDMLQAIR
jgi:hypothetical protein